MTRSEVPSPFATEARRAPRSGVALAIVLAALVLAAALAAGAVMAADQSMRDATGSLERARARAAAENAIARTASPSAWNPAWSSVGPPGLQATIATLSPGATDTLRVIRLAPALYLLMSESHSLPRGPLSAHSRIAQFIVLDSVGAPMHPQSHGWAEMP